MARKRTTPGRIRRPYRIDLGQEIYLHVEVEGDPEPHVVPTVIALSRQVALAARREADGVDPFQTLREALVRGKRNANAIDSLAPLDAWDEAIADLGRIEDVVVEMLDRLGPEEAREALLRLSRPESPPEVSEGASGPEDAPEDTP